MKVNELILKLTKLRNIYGDVDVEYDVKSSINQETEIDDVSYDDDYKCIILSAY